MLIASVVREDRVYQITQGKPIRYCTCKRDGTRHCVSGVQLGVGRARNACSSEHVVALQH